MQTCLEYVLETLSKTQHNDLKKTLISKSFFRNKSSLKEGDTIVFTHGFHVGFGEINTYLEVITDECSDGVIFSRNLSLHDDRLKVALVNPKRKKGSKTNGKME